MEVICDPSGLVADAKLPKEHANATDDTLSPRQLFEKGRFSEAVFETTKLIESSSDDVESALDLWYIRLQSLLIMLQGQIAAEEIAHNLSPLDDEQFVSSVLTEPRARLKSWRLRILVVPVKTKGINQAAIQQYYSLGFEARREAATSDSEDMRSKWLELVKLAGFYALSTLIALRDYMTAINLLKVHYETTSDPVMAQLLALLHILMGDTLGSQAWCSKITDKEMIGKILKLGKFIDSSMDASAELDEFSAVADTCQGSIATGIAKLEDEVLKHHANTGLIQYCNISNLFVLYDLCFSAPPTSHCRALLKRLGVAGGIDEKLELITELRRA